MQLGKFDCATGLINILYSKNDLIVRNATIADQIFIDKLQKDNSYAVGFIQKTVWEKYVFGGERNFVVFVCEKNNEEVGYILLTPGRGINSYVRIQQIAVRDDARRLDYGSALIAVVKEFCQTFQRIGARLRCRVDLESNHFWQALGFQKYGIWQKGMINHVGFKASNDINLWQIDLNTNLLSLFDENDFERKIWTPTEAKSNLNA
jgi:GNAT superfamily N-acetyltransferase